MSDPVPHDIRRLADERARARRGRDWAAADRLKAELAAAGWRVVDAATLYSLERLAPAVVAEDGELRYGASDAVPSRLAEPDQAPASVILVAGEGADTLPGGLSRAVADARAGAPGAQVVVVANAPSEDVGAEIARLPPDVEVLRLARRLGAAAALNAGLRRAVGKVAVTLDLRVAAEGDLVGTLAGALVDPSVGVAGLRGLATDDLVRFTPAPAGQADVVAVDGLAMAFRRADYAESGPLDEHFTLPDYLDAWWSLVLRDVPGDSGAADAPGDGEGADGVAADGGRADGAPRRAVVLAVPFALRGEPDAQPDERLLRKHRYRFLKRFATRRDLLLGPLG